MDYLFDLTSWSSTCGSHPQDFLANFLVTPSISLQSLPPDSNNIEVWYPHHLQLEAELGQATGVSDLAAENVSLLLDCHALVDQSPGELSQDRVWVVVRGGGNIAQSFPGHSDRTLATVQS